MAGNYGMRTTPPAQDGSLLSSRTEVKRVSLLYGEAYERALLADEAFRQAGAARLKAMNALDEAEKAMQEWYDGLAATIRLVAKDRHPDIDPTRTLGRDANE